MNYIHDGFRTFEWPVIRKSRRMTYRARLKVMRDEPLPARRSSRERRILAHGEPRPLIVRGTGKLVAYACHNCGGVQSLKFDGHEDRAYAAALECCRRPARCKCGTYIDKHQYKCGTCRSRDSYLSDRNRARKAMIVEDTGDPVWSPMCSGDWGDGYASCVDEMLRCAEDDGLEPPCFVFATNGVTPEVVIDRIMESLAEDMHEDFEVENLPGHDALCDAIDAFNKAQTNESFEIDFKRVIVIDATKFEEYLSEDYNGVPDTRYIHNPRLAVPARAEASS